MKKGPGLNLTIVGLVVVLGIVVALLYIGVVEEALEEMEAAEKAYEESLKAEEALLNEENANDTNAVNIDSNLVNPPGEEWICRGENNDYRAFTFRANGRYRYRYYLAGENYDRLTGGGRWSADSGRITLISGNDANADGEEGGKSQPYTVSDTAIEIGGDIFKRQTK